MFIKKRAVVALVVVVVVGGCPARDASGEGEGEGEGECGGGDAEPDVALSIDPTVAAFGAVLVGEVGQALRFAVTAPGDVCTTTGVLSAFVAGDFAIIGGTCGPPLGQAETCIIDVVFAPSEQGARTGALTVTSGDASASAALSGTGVGAAELAIDPPSVTFSDVIVGDESELHRFTVVNNGDTSTGGLSVTLAGAGADQVRVLSDECFSVELEPTESCVVDVAFAPTVVAQLLATLTVDAASADSVLATLSGAALAPAQLSVTPASRNFGTVSLGNDSAELDVAITNEGDVDSGVLVTTLEGADADEMTVTSSGCVDVALAPGASCIIGVTFSPVGGFFGPRTARLAVRATPGGEAIAQLTATVGGHEGFSINPAAVDFGSVGVGQASSVETFTIDNSGGMPNGPLATAISGVDAAQFLVDDDTCEGATVPAGETCAVQIHFLPSGSGDRAASLVVTSTASGDQAIAALAGFGTNNDDVIFVNPAGIDFGDVVVGAQSAPVSAFVQNAGATATSPLTVTLGGANASQFLIVDDACVGAALEPNGAACTIRIAYAPAMEGSHNGTVTVTGSPGGTTVVQLTGQGVPP